MAKQNRSTNAGKANQGLNWGAPLTPAEVSDSERRLTAGDWALARRVTLSVLTRTPAELQAAWATPEGMDAMADALEMAMAWRDHLTEAAELADAALDRLATTGRPAVKVAES